MGGAAKSAVGWQRNRVGAIALLAAHDDTAKVARLFHFTSGLGEVAAAAALRTTLAQVPPLFHRDGTLIAGAGFVCVGIEAPTTHRLPSESEFTTIVRCAEDAAQKVQKLLPKQRPTLCFGIDVLATCARDSRWCQAGQFAALLIGDQAPTLVRKSYPTTGETAYLRIDASERHRVAPAPQGQLAMLVCHDLNAFSRRGQATTTNRTRKRWRTSLRQEVSSAKPKRAVHLIHELATYRSFLDAYGGWSKEHRTVDLFGVAGLAASVSAAEARDIAAVLCAPRGRPTIDLWERPPLRAGRET